MLASVGLPGLVGFVGEFLVLSGTFAAQDALFPHPKLMAALATTGVILGAVYMLYMFQKVMFGPLSNPRNRDLPDLTGREKAVFLPVVAMIFVMGIYPAPFLSRMTASVTRVTSEYKKHYQTSKEIGADGDAKLLPAEGAATVAPPPQPNLVQPGMPQQPVRRINPPVENIQPPAPRPAP
jgi:NADH-quinone oxidoreductase subunit M